MLVLCLIFVTCALVLATSVNVLRFGYVYLGRKL